MTLLLFILVVPLTGFRSQRQEGLCRQVAGKMIYASPGDNPSTKANSLSPGDRLILPDSLYANSQLHMDGIHGTPTAPITIPAEHDGEAIIDGAGRASHVIEGSNRSYIIDEYGVHHAQDTRHPAPVLNASISLHLAMNYH